MTTPDLFGDDVRPKTHKAVPRTSVTAGQGVNKDERIRCVLKALERFSLAYGHAPTSAELAHFHYQLNRGVRPNTDQKLYVRRGLSDAQERGFTAHVPQGSRICQVCGRPCVTWKVQTR